MDDNTQVPNPSEPADEVENRQIGAEPVSSAAGQTPGATEQSDLDLFLAAINGEIPETQSDYDGVMLTPLERGQIVKGTIASINNSEILVDVGAKSEGIISEREIAELDSQSRAALHVGQEIMVFVISPEDRGGNIRLSLKRAMEEQYWEEARQFLDNKETYTSTVIGHNKGGLIVRFGQLRGFVPASQLSVDRRRRGNGQSAEESWAEMNGEEILVKVIEVDRGRNRLILSERAASREVRAARRSELMDELTVGDIRSGRVISLADFGAFVDLGGVDGLIHLSELAWEPVTHPRDVLKVGDEVQVEVISVDTERQRIGLSRKRCLENPWDSLVANYQTGQLVQGSITKLTKFGAFARLTDQPAVEGLIHISELSNQRVNHPGQVVQEGQVLTLRIINIDTTQRRIGLSLKRVESEDYMEEDWGGAVAPTPVESSGDEPDAE